MSALSLIEILATLTSLTYLLLLIKQNIWCWFFSIISGLLSIYLFYSTKLYLESILYGYFVLISCYGWWNWSKRNGSLRMREWKPIYHIFTVFIGFALACGLGYFFSTKTDASKPYLDAGTTVFSIIANILEARKMLSGWIYWIIINGVSVGLYLSKSLHIYAGLMIVYFIMSIVGYREWKKDLAGSTQS